MKVDGNGSRCRFAGCHAIGRVFDAMRHGIAQQMLKRRGHAVQHTAVHVQRTAHDVQLDGFARIFGGLAYHAVQALRDAFEFHHPGAQQVALQFTGLASLGNQVILGSLHRALQIALHRGDVMDRLRHHAGEFLHAGKAVKFQWIETLGGIFGLRQSRLHLRLGLQFDIAQLMSQPVQIAGHFTQRSAHLTQARLQPGARDHDLASLVNHAIKQLRTHAHALIGYLARRRQRRKRDNSQRSRRDWRWPSFDRRIGCEHLIWNRTGLGQTQGLLRDGTQRVKVGVNRVKPCQQGLQLGCVQGLGPQMLDG